MFSCLRELCTHGFYLCQVIVTALIKGRLSIRRDLHHSKRGVESQKLVNSSAVSATIRSVALGKTSNTVVYQKIPFTIKPLVPEEFHQGIMESSFRSI